MVMGALVLVCGPARIGRSQLSPFAAQKARTLLRERLPCLGCHQLDGEGGRLGPDLGVSSSGASAAFVYAMIRDPQRTRPGSAMPKTPMSPATFELVASAVHADATTMSERSDDMLFDAIASGGYVLGRSNRMPGFGATLSSAEIRGLVRHIRELCRCEGSR